SAGPSLTNEVEVKSVDVAAQALNLHLPGNSPEVAGASDDVDPIVMSPKVTTDIDVAEAADVAVEVDRGAAPELLDVGLFSAIAPVAADPVAAVSWIEEVVLETEPLVRPVARGLLRDHAEVMIERGGGREREHRGGERSESPNGDELAHELSSL